MWRRYVPVCLVFALAVAFASNSICAQAADAKQKNNNVSLELKDVNIKSALESLFKVSGINYTIDSNVTGTIPVLSFKDVPFDVALKQLVKSAGLVYRIDSASNIYIISKRQEIDQSPDMRLQLAPGNNTSVALEEPIADEMIIEKITLANASAREILDMLTGETREYGGFGNYGTLGSAETSLGSNNSNWSNNSSGFNRYNSSGSYRNNTNRGNYNGTNRGW